MVTTRSVWSQPAKEDGLRILVSRFRGRGLPTSQYDVWMPALGPSEALLRSIQSGDIDWKTFTRRYRDELFLDGAIDAGNRTIKNHGQKSTLRLIKTIAARQHVTLLCHCAEDATQCHRFILAKEVDKV
jgi:uncharacterized protein YeaO (DUF488 family)